MLYLSGPVGCARGGLLDGLALHNGEEARRAAVTLFLRLEAWLVFGAVRLRARAAGVEGAPLRRGRRRGDVAGQHDPLSLALLVGIGDGDRGEERVGVRIAGLVVEFLAVGYLDYLAQIHN